MLQGIGRLPQRWGIKDRVGPLVPKGQRAKHSQLVDQRTVGTALGTNKAVAQAGAHGSRLPRTVRTAWAQCRQQTLHAGGAASSQTQWQTVAPHTAEPLGGPRRGQALERKQQQQCRRPALGNSSGACGGSNLPVLSPPERHPQSWGSRPLQRRLQCLPASATDPSTAMPPGQAPAEGRRSQPIRSRKGPVSRP